jgi:hypothetical protein
MKGPFAIALFASFALASCQSTAPAQARPGSDTMVFVKYTEQKEQAWTMLIPKGWQTEGGIRRIDPVSTGDAANAIAAKVDFAVKKDAKGSVMMRWLPDMYRVDSSYTPAGQLGMFPEGSRMNGMLVMRCPSAKDYLLKVAFPEAHPNPTDVKLVSSKAQPKVVSALKELTKTVPLMGSFSYDAVLVTATYTEGGVKYKEQAFTVIENMGQVGAGMWQNKSTILARAPVDEFDKWAPVGAVLVSSVKLSPTWVEAQLKGEAERTQIYQQTQREIQRIGEEIVANHQKTSAEINNDMFLVLTGQEEYINPYTGQTEVRPDGWKYHWQNESGELVVTDSEEYDPNLDVELKRTGFKRSAARKR